MGIFSIIMILFTYSITNLNHTVSAVNDVAPSVPGGVGMDIPSPGARVYFKAKGVFPTWNLSISEDQISFQSAEIRFENVTAPHAEPVKVMGANVKKYTLQSDAGPMEIELYAMLCENEGSKERFPYSVTVSIRHAADTTFTSFTGCGAYVTDDRLREKWTLESIKGIPVDSTTFNDSLPYLSINPNGNAFSGFAGCNTMHGRIFFERNLLRFTDIVPAKTTCEAITKEKEFLSSLGFVTQYAFEEDRLILSNPTGQMLTLRKSD